MKIRNGFVSNSSSSSYIVIGFKITNESDIEKIFKHIEPKYNSGDEEFDEAFIEKLYDYYHDDKFRIVGDREAIGYAIDIPKYDNKIIDFSWIEESKQKIIDMGFNSEDIKVIVGEFAS